MTTLPNYSPFVIGHACYSQQTVCKSGAIYLFSVEQYAEGYKAFAYTPEGKLSHTKLCKTAQKAVNALAKLL